MAYGAFKETVERGGAVKRLAIWKPIAIAAFTKNQAEHLAELRRIVRHPERLRVVATGYTEELRRTVQEEVITWLDQHHPDSLASAGRGWDVVVVRLEATAGDAAQQLWDRHGAIGPASRLEAGSSSLTSETDLAPGESGEFPLLVGTASLR